MHFINKIIEQNVDQSVHNRFVKFSKGTYKNGGPVIVVKVGKNFKLNINSSHEYEDQIGLFMSSILPGGQYSVIGNIYTQPRVSPDNISIDIEGPWQRGKRDLKSLSFKMVNTQMQPDEIQRLYENLMDQCYILLSIMPSSGKIWSMNTKEVVPSLKKIQDKTPLDTCKPETQAKCKNIDFCSENGICIKKRVGFCKAKTGPLNGEAMQAFRKAFLKDFLDIPQDFTELKLVNQYQINNLIFPPNKEDLTSKEIREQTKRAGIINRILYLDGKKYENPIDFEA